MDNNSTPATWYDGSFFKGFQSVLPFINWAILLTCFVGGAMLFNRDSNISQAAALRELQAEQKRTLEAVALNKQERVGQIQDIKKEMLPREVFDAKMEALRAELEQTRKLTEKILERQK